MYVSAVLTIS